MRRHSLLFLLFTLLFNSSILANPSPSLICDDPQLTRLRPTIPLPTAKQGSSQFRKFPQARVEGHRGAGFLEKENSLQAFQRAIDLGLDGIETDVWLSKDNVLIVYHGLVGDFIKFKDGKEKVIEVDSKDLKDRILSNGERVLLFEEVLDLCKDKISLNIEIKDGREEIVEKLLDMLQEKDMLNQISFSSFHHFLRRKLTSEVAKRGIKETLSFGFLNHIYDLKFPKFGEETLPGDTLNLDIRYLTGSQEKKCLAQVEEAAKYGMSAKFWFPWLYTMEESTYEKLIEVGVDTILTNKPQVVMEYLANKAS